MITGQGNGQGAREQGQKCDQLPGSRDISNPEHRKYIASVWGVPKELIPQKGLSAIPLVEAIHDGKIKGVLSICFNPAVSLPDGNYVRKALEKLEFYVNIDFFLSETARYAGIVLPGSLMEEDEGTTTNVEGRVIRHRQAVIPPEGARQDWSIINEIAARLGYADKFSAAPREIFEELHIASKGGVSDYSGMTWDRIDENYGLFWPCPEPGHPGTPRLYEGGKFGHPDGKAHFIPIEWRPSAEMPDEEYPIILTTGRVVSHFLSGTQTRRIGGLMEQYPQPRCEIHPRLAEKLGIVENDFVKVESRRGEIVVRAQVVKTIRPDTVFVPITGRWIARQTIAPSVPSTRCRTFLNSRSAQCASARLRLPPMRSHSLRWRREAFDERHGFLHRPLALHRMPVVRAGLRRVRHPSRCQYDSPRDHPAF
jgi:assimilatory nitrate reductase catalytic subunit